MIGPLRHRRPTPGPAARSRRAMAVAVVALSVCAASCGDDSSVRGSTDTSASPNSESPPSVQDTASLSVADDPRSRLLSGLVEDPTLSDAQKTCIAASIESFSDDELGVIEAASEAAEPDFDDPTFAKWVEASMGCMNAGASLIDQVKNRSNLVLSDVQEACVDGYLGELTDEDLQALIDAPDNPYDTDLAACITL
jgi:hypothetical protein